MKKILLLVLFIGVCVCSFAQRTNARGEYMVKSATWKSHTGTSSFSISLEYNTSNELVKLSKRYTTTKNEKVLEQMFLKKDNGRYLKYVRYENGKQTFNIKATYTFNKNNVINYISIFVPSCNKMVSTYQMFYDDTNAMTKMIHCNSENGGIGWNCKYITYVNWEDGNIVSDKMIEEDDPDFPFSSDFVYIPEEKAINNTNINFNFLIMKSHGVFYNDDVVMCTEWFGRKTNLLLRGTESDLNGSLRIKPHYEYLIENGVIKKVLFKTSRVQEYPHILGTLTLEYLY